MPLGRNGDDHGVDEGQDLAEVGGVTRTKALTDLAGAIAVPIRDGRQMHALAALGEQRDLLGVEAPHVPDPDDTDLDRLHACSAVGPLDGTPTTGIPAAPASRRATPRPSL